MDATCQTHAFSQFISDFFDGLNDAEIDYSVLRGYELLPTNVINDIDLYLNPDQWYTVEIIIGELLLKYAAKRVITTDRFGFKRVIFSIAGSYLQLDISFSLNWKSFNYCSSITVSENIKSHNNIKVSREGVEAAIVLLKELLYNGKVKTRRNGKERLLFCVKNDLDLFKKTLALFLPHVIVDTLAKEIINEAWAKVESKVHFIRRRIIVSNFKAEGLKLLISFMKWGYMAVADKIQARRGFFAAIVGPDGSGKTTLVNEVNRELNETLFTKTNHYASNFEILPLLSNIVGLIKGNKLTSVPRNNDSFQGYLAGMEQQPNSSLRSCIYILWYGLDLMLGRWVIIRKRSRGELLFFARYFYDYYYQRSNRNAPQWLLNWVHFFIPKPDVVFYIDRDANDIFQIKPELALEEIVRQQASIDMLAQKYPRFLKINGNHGIAESKKQIIETINDLLASRI